MRHLKLSLFLEGVFYDDNGVETERVTLDANGDLRMINVERRGGIRWCVWKKGRFCLRVRMGGGRMR